MEEELGLVARTGRQNMMTLYRQIEAGNREVNSAMAELSNFGGIGNGGKTKKEITYIAYRKEIMRTNANLIYQIITKTTTGKFGMPSNDKHFSRNIATIAGLGDEYMLRKILYESRVQKTAHVVEGKLRVPIIQGNQGIQASKASRHYSCRQIFAFSQDT